MLKALYLKHVGPAANMDMAPIASRINLITGDNGLGKSFLLDIAWFGLTASWPEHPAAVIDLGHAAEAGIEFLVQARGGDHEFGYAYHQRTQDWLGFANQNDPTPAEDYIAMYIRANGSVCVYDTVRGEAERKQAKSPFVFDAGKVNFASGEIWDGLKVGDRHLCNGLIRDVALWQTGKDKRFKLLQEIVAKLSPGPDEKLEFGDLTRVWITDVRDMPTVKMPYSPTGEPIIFSSSAIRRVISWAYLLVWTWDEHLRAAALAGRDPAKHFVILIDELETHLHPRWQRTLLPSLLPAVRNLSKQRAKRDGMVVQVLATTHSPLILASAEPFFDPKQDALWKLDLEDGQVKLERDEWHLRGDASDWLTSDVFDLGSSGSLEAEAARNEAARIMSSEPVDPEAAMQIHKELLKFLPAADPFWARWRYIGERKGWLAKPKGAA
jgi:predicted ATPase